MYRSSRWLISIGNFGQRHSRFCNPDTSRFFAQSVSAAFNARWPTIVKWLSSACFVFARASFTTIALPAEDRAIQPEDRFLRVLVSSHFHKAKSAGAACHLVGYDRDSFNRAVSL